MSYPVLKTQLSPIWDRLITSYTRFILIWHIVARRSSSSTKKSCATFLEADPFSASVRHEASAIHLRDPYPYEFSYASGRYIFMTEFICWEPRGRQRLITPHHSFSSPRAVCLWGSYSIHYSFTLDRRGNPIHILRMWRVFSNRS